jgi:uncharacterized protein (DUF3820 family)
MIQERYLVPHNKFVELLEKYNTLEKRVFLLENNHVVVHKREVDLPEHLYRTWHALKRGSATATQIGEIIEVHRALASNYLNQLKVMKLVCKKTNSKHEAIFSLVENQEQL